ncbi:MAG: Glycolate dehydrogenase, iron-sulfur subunit GlcF [Afipia sp.]|jgi:glycolate oxidase iron-sulfur subunit|nr:MAG: Glycolate dehydrogenase, iron-sulfur subunit GlcF [Afipia sp.]
MQTNFSLTALVEPHMNESERILRACVHCGFCTATCPTYLLLGDELDSPRGRIYLIKDMFENEKPASETVVKHVDRCLSCLSCMTTCPSGVHYMHLVDHARAHITKTYKRPLVDRVLRGMLAAVLPNPKRLRLALLLAAAAKPMRKWLARLPGGAQLAAMVDLAPALKPPKSAAKGSVAQEWRGRVAILTGCAQQVIDPGINAAAIRLLNRHGIEVASSRDEGCCGALVHHMGYEEPALQAARRNVDVWTQELEKGGLDAIIVTASGCGTTIKDYGFMLRGDKAYARKAARISELAQDISEYLCKLQIQEPVRTTGQIVAYHSACSMQHGQRVVDQPKLLLKQMGFVVKDIPEGHVCCGSAGTYNVLQPEIAGQLRSRKVSNIEKTKPQIIASGNLGCITQISAGTTIPIVHTVELLDWATGGPIPDALEGS